MLWKVVKQEGDILTVVNTFTVMEAAITWAEENKTQEGLYVLRARKGLSLQKALAGAKTDPKPIKCFRA